MHLCLRGFLDLMASFMAFPPFSLDDAHPCAIGENLFKSVKFYNVP